MEEIKIDVDLEQIVGSLEYTERIDLLNYLVGYIEPKDVAEMCNQLRNTKKE